MLKQILQHAMNHAWYRDHQGDLDLSSWPILTKESLYERLATTQDLLLQGGIYYSRSGGTSGAAPLYFPSDVWENHAQRAALAKHIKADGILGNQNIAMNICPILRMYRAMEIFNEYCDHCQATVLPMGALVDDQEIYEQSRLFKANTLIGMPSRLVAFARYMQENDLSHTFDRVFFGGEFLQPAKRTILSEVFGVIHFSGAYGSAELGVVAWNADLQELPIYHFAKNITHVEVLPIAGKDYGELVVTNILRTRFPLIRYRTGDLARILSEDETRATVQLLGRKSDSFQMGDDYYNLSDFSDLLRPYEAFQILIDFDQKRQADAITFRLVGGNISLYEKTKKSLADLFLADGVYYHLEVHHVDLSELVVTAGSQKIPAIIDRRGF